MHSWVLVCDNEGSVPSSYVASQTSISIFDAALESVATHTPISSWYLFRLLSLV